MALDETAFETLAGQTLARFMDAIDDALGDCMDVDMQNGILTIELDSGGEYVINKHAPNRQIWLSSPISGAAHYDYDEAATAWVSSRDGSSLIELLSAELSAAAGTPFSLG